MEPVRCLHSTPHLSKRSWQAPTHVYVLRACTCTRSENNTRARNEPNVLRRNQNNITRVQLQMQRVMQVLVRFQLQRTLPNMNVQGCDKLQIVLDKPSSRLCSGISTADNDILDVFTFPTVKKWQTIIKRGPMVM